MSSHEDLNAILKRIENGTQTEADVAALRQLLRGERRSQVLQQLAKYNVYLDKAEGIQIGDRYYNTPKQETAEVDFRRYLRSLTEEYQHWWEKYTLTDALGREKRKREGRSPSEWNFDLMVQTARRQEPQEQREEQGEEQQKEKIERFPVLEGLRKYAKDHVLLVGRPGSGKSTALVRLLLEEAALTPLPPSPNSGRGGSRLEPEVLAPASLPPQIPVLVELRFWKTSMHDRILKFLQKHDPALNLSEPTVEALLKQGRLLLLVDGLNELPSEEARRDVARFRQDYGKTTPMIFTTRELSVGGDLGIEKKLEMQPLTEGQMRSFVKAYLPERGDALLAQLKDRLRELGKTPLLLAMLCSIFQSTKQIPNNLGDVFRQFTQFYENRVKQDVPVTEESRRWWSLLLQRLAFVMMHENSQLLLAVDFRIAIAQAEVLQTFEECLQDKVTAPGDRARECLKDLLEHHLIHLNGDQIEFRHQLLQEYYAAEYLLQLLPKFTDDQLKHNYLNYLKWTEPFALMLALVGEEKVAVRLVKLAMNEVDLMLGARLAGEVKPEFQSKTVALINQLKLSGLLKYQCFKVSHSEEAISQVLTALEARAYDVRSKAVEVLGEIGSEAAVSGLLKALRHQDSYIRRRAAEALGKIGSETSVAELIRALDDQDPNVRRRATEALGNISSGSSIAGLLQALEHQDSNVRWRATEALGRIGNEAAVARLLEAVGDQNSNVRWKATEALGRIGDEAAAAKLLQALKHQDSNVRWRASEALGEIGSQAAVPRLIKALEDQDSYVRKKAAEALKKIGGESSIIGLFQALKHQDSNVRWRASEALGQIGGETAVIWLLKAVKNWDNSVRRSATEALGQIGGETAIEGLVKALEDQSSDVRWSAAVALRKIGGEAAVAGLLKALEDQNSNVRWSAAEALGEIRSEASVSGLVKALEHQDYKVRRSATEVLGRIGGEAAVAGLLKTLEDQNSDVRQTVAGALGRIGSEAAVAGLLKALEDKDSAVCRRAAEALEKIGGEAAVAGLLKALEDKDSSVRWRAAEALEKIGGEAAVVGLLKALEDKDNSTVRWRAAEALGKIRSQVA